MLETLSLDRLTNDFHFTRNFIGIDLSITLADADWKGCEVASSSKSYLGLSLE